VGGVRQLMIVSCLLLPAPNRQTDASIIVEIAIWFGRRKQCRRPWERDGLRTSVLLQHL
jgi:hypothetical protein